MTALDEVAERYSTILCDIWGVVHDGARLLPGAAERLLAWKRAGKRIILITNAPRPASTVSTTSTGSGCRAVLMTRSPVGARRGSRR